MTSGPRTNTTQDSSQNQFSDSLSQTSVRANPLLNPRLNTALNAADTAIRAGTQDPNLQSAEGLVGDTLQGRFLGEGNPFLEQQFQQGADAITQRLNSGFAGAGRNIAAGRPAAADELGNFRAQLFGPAFENERDRQVAAVGQAQQLNPLDRFIDRIGQLSGIAGRDVGTRDIGNVQGTSQSNQTTRQKQSVLDRVFGIAGLF